MELNLIILISLSFKRKGLNIITILKSLKRLNNDHVNSFKEFILKNNLTPLKIRLKLT